jgi:antitoxin CptB
MDPDAEALRRLQWQCRRGMLELDLLLQGFLERQWGTLDDAERQAFERLLAYSDQVLLECLMGRFAPVDPAIADVIGKIRQDSAR